MKKDKEWLKEEINKEVKNIDYPLRYSTNEYNVRMSMIEAFKEKVDQLDEPEITEEQAWELIGGYNGMTAKEANQMFADGMVNRKSDKSIKRDDVLDRLQEIGEHNRNEWIEVILRKFGNDYGTVKYQAGHEQGYLNGILKSKEDELVEIPQFVDDWIRGITSGEISESGTGEEDLIFEICQQYYEETLPEELSKWFSNNVNSYIFYRAVLDGYTIEPPKTLQVIVKNYDSTVYKTELPEDEAMKLIEGWKN